MGKVRIIPNISYASDNLGKLSGINVNIPSGKAIIIRNASFTSNNLGKVEFMGNEVGDELKITSAGNITISFPNNLEYKYDANVWNNWETYTANETLQIAPGKSIIFKGDLTPNENIGIGTFTISGDCTVSGNPLSLINYGNISNYTFKYLFKDCTYLLNAEDLILPNTTAIECYKGMFENCTSLEKSPNLPASVLSVSCYEAMFKNCTILESAPLLKAISLVTDCYKEMFYNCESLNNIEINATDLLGEDYSLNWVYNVAASGNFKQPSSISNEFGVNAIPTGWTTVIDYSQVYFTIESLADSNTISTAKAKSCSINPVIYYSTDNGETWTQKAISSSTTTITTINNGDKLLLKSTTTSWATVWDTYNKITCSKNFKVYGNVMSLINGDNFVNNSEFTTGTTHNLVGLFYGVTTLTDASNLIMPALTCMSSSYNGMFRGCTNLTTAPKLPAINSAQDCYSSMFEGCINLEIAPEINLVNMSQNCCKRMFCMDRNNKITTPKMTKSPILRCATSASGCYEEMFKGNGNLIEVTCLKTDSTDACTNFLTNVSTTGTFYKSPLKTDWASSGKIPSGWTIIDYVEE